MRRTYAVIAAGLAVPLLLGVAGGILFYVVKTPPPHAPCEEFMTGAQRAARAAYIEGVEPFAAVSALILLALIVLASARQRLAAGWDAAVPPETSVAVLLALVLLALHLGPAPTFELHALLAVLVGLVGGQLLMALAAWSALRHARRRPDFALGWLLTYLWMAALVALPALLAFPLGEGTDYFCINGIV